jgi:hypothetical protein
MEQLNAINVRYRNFSAVSSKSSLPSTKNSTYTIENLINEIRSNCITKVIVMCGAGIF